MADLLRVSKIHAHTLFRDALLKIEESETDRIYCGHGMSHILDVARLGCIFAAERGYDIAPDIIYAAAFLHDIGRGEEYENGKPHHEGSVEIAKKILPECGFSDAETAQILMAIATHRVEESEMGLGEVLYDADKKSRPCYACEARDSCKWPKEKMNLVIPG